MNRSQFRSLRHVWSAVWPRQFALPNPTLRRQKFPSRSRLNYNLRPRPMRQSAQNPRKPKPNLHLRADKYA